MIRKETGNKRIKGMHTKEKHQTEKKKMKEYNKMEGTRGNERIGNNRTKEKELESMK